MKYLAGYIITLLLSLALLNPLDASADVNNFTISKFDAEYSLSRDEQGHSSLQVVERISAEFPDYDQNKGLVREIPLVFNDRPVKFDLESVNRNGQTEPIYSQYKQNNHQVIELGTDEYIRGTQNYEIRYKLLNVTAYFDNLGRDEFYWDINGTGWRVPIDQLSVRVSLSEEIESSRIGEAVCYQGAYGSSDTCEIGLEDGSYQAAVSDLGVGENVTIAVGFEAGTFAQYQPSLAERLYSWWLASLWVTIPIGIAAMAAVSVLYKRWSERTREIGTIVPEYLAPKEISIPVAADISGYKAKTVGAQLLDLAVRGYLEIYETRPKSFWRHAEYELVMVGDKSELLPEEREILDDIFGTSAVSGDKVSTKTLRSSQAIGMKLTDNATKVQKLTRSDYALRAQTDETKSKMRQIALVLLVLGVSTLGPVIILASLVAYGVSFAIWPLTDKGLEAKRYLEGLKMYISVAESERLKILQSPEGAEKLGSFEPEDPAQRLKLYERLLPYAVLFGQEKQWNKVLGECYRSNDSQPSWYHGKSAFTAATLSQITSGASSIGATSSSSSSSGGSGGGGFSGGGGGGGGGGGR